MLQKLRFLVIFDYLLPISPTKLQKIHQIRKKICIFRKKAVLLQPISVISHTEVVYATSTFRRVAIVAQLVEQRIRNAWVAGSSPASGSKRRKRVATLFFFFCAICPLDFEPLRGPLNARGVLGKSEG